MRLRARVDSNQREIVKALRTVGASVQPIHQLGKGVPDLLVGFRGVNYLMEIKDGEKNKSKRKLTTDENKWMATWEGGCHVINSVTEALYSIGVKLQ